MSDNKTSHEDSEDNNSPSCSEDTLKEMHKDLRVTHQGQLDNLNELRDIGLRIIQVNGLVLTILASLATQVRLTSYVNVATVLSVIGFIGSTIIAGTTLINREVDGGITKSATAEIVDHELTSSQYYMYMARDGYGAWIKDTGDIIDKRAKKIQWAVILFIGSILLLVAGILFSILINYA